MVVRDHMSTPVVVIGPDSDYMTALRMMQDHHLHHLPVVDANGHLIGILAERDLLLAAANFLQNPIEVASVMHRNVVTALPETPLAEAATLMVSYSIGGLPVMDADQQVIGIITETDIFRAFVKLLAAGEPVHPHRLAGS